MPIGVPGMGKSFYIENIIIPSCIKLNLKFYVLSIEQTYLKIYEIWKKQNPSI